METFYLTDYIKENSQHPEVIDLLKYEIDKRIYYYGEQFKNPFENNSKRIHIYDYLKDSFTIYKILVPNKITQSDKNILSNAYFTVNKYLKSNGYNVFRPSWNISLGDNIFPDLKIFLKSKKIKDVLNYSPLSVITSEKFISYIKLFEKELEMAILQKHIKAIIVPNDLSFFEQLLIKIGKKNQIPTFIFLHGLPGRYNQFDDNCSDYLIVWGEKIRDNYVNLSNFSQKKIIISGHPHYQLNGNSKFSFSMENILVLTKSMNGGQHRDKVRIQDRGNSILYLYSIEKVLRKLGVVKVRIRPHPSENMDWYFQYIDRNFFTIDNQELTDSLKSSTLIIGPTSTVFLESVYLGVNYIVYEPTTNDEDVFYFNLVPPFNGQEDGIPLAKSEIELADLINKKSTVNPSFLNGYLKTPFDLSGLSEIIN